MRIKYSINDSCWCIAHGSCKLLIIGIFLGSILCMRLGEFMNQNIIIIDEERLLDLRMRNIIESELYQIGQISPYGSSIVLKVGHAKDLKASLFIDSNHFNFKLEKSLVDLSATVKLFLPEFKFALGEWKKTRFDNSKQSNVDPYDANDSILEQQNDDTEKC